MLTDLFGKEIEEGDKVYVARHSGRTDAKLDYAEVTRITNSRINFCKLDEAGKKLEPEYKISSFSNKPYKSFNPEFYINYTRSNKIVIVSRKGEII